MMHDFVVTERRVVLFDLPAVFDVEGMLVAGGGGFIRWEPDHGARIGVLDRGAPGDSPLDRRRAVLGLPLPQRRTTTATPWWSRAAGPTG